MSIYYMTILLAYCTAKLSEIGTPQDKLARQQNHLKISNNLVCAILTAALLILVAGLRWRVGTDYWQYTRNYTAYQENFVSDLVTFNEPGIKLIATVSRWIFDDPATMFFIAAVITVGLTIRTIAKYSDMFAFSVMLYVFMGLWTGSFNAVRQYLACAILFAGHRYILDRQFVKYLLVVLLASAFHISALVMIFLYFVPQKNLKISDIVLIMLVSIVILYSYELIFSFLEKFVGGSFAENGYALKKVNIYRVAVTFAPLLIYFFLTAQSTLKKEHLLYVNIMFVNAAMMLAASNSAYLTRMVMYTSIFSSLGFPGLLRLKNPKFISVIRIVVLVLYLMFWYLDVAKDEALTNFRWIFNRF